MYGEKQHFEGNTVDFLFFICDNVNNLDYIYLKQGSVASEKMTLCQIF